MGSLTVAFFLALIWQPTPTLLIPDEALLQSEKIVLYCARRLETATKAWVIYARIKRTSNRVHQGSAR